MVARGRPFWKLAAALTLSALSSVSWASSCRGRERRALTVDTSSDIYERALVGLRFA